MTVSLWLGWYRAGAEAIKTLEHAVHHHFWERFWGRGANVGIHTEANDRPVVQLGAGVTRQEFPQGAEKKRNTKLLEDTQGDGEEGVETL